MACGDEGNEEETKQMQAGLSERPPKDYELEAMVAEEAEALEHVILIENPLAPTTPGFDVVSFDPITRELHIWEAKNVGGTVGLGSLSAFLNAWGLPSPAQLKKYGDYNAAAEYAIKRASEELWGDKHFRNTTGILGSVPKGMVQDIISEAIGSGKVHYHLRGGPETTYTKDLQEVFAENNFDIKNYGNIPS